MARTPICICKDCNRIGTVRIPIAKRGDRFGYLCEYHAHQEEGYSVENGYHYGVAKKNGFTFAMELETSDSNGKARGELADFGFKPTYDCTVDVEYKSPIFEGLNALSKQCVSIEKLIASDCMRICSECGKEFNVYKYSKTKYCSRECVEKARARNYNKK